MYEVREVFLKLHFVRSCSYLQRVKAEIRRCPWWEKKTKWNSKDIWKKDAGTWEISTWEENKRRLESDFEALKSSADEYAEKAETSGKLTCIAKFSGMRRTDLEKEEQIKSLKQEIEQKL